MEREVHRNEADDASEAESTKWGELGKGMSKKSEGRSQKWLRP
jgi:hypothetical protein